MKPMVSLLDCGEEQEMSANRKMERIDFIYLRVSLDRSRNICNKFGATLNKNLKVNLWTEYAELSPQHKPLREEVIRLRQVQNAVDTALRRREQPQEVQRKKHEMEL